MAFENGHPNYLIRHTEVTKRKISEKLKGKMPKFIPNNKGLKRSEETKIKMSESQKGKIGYWKGKKLSEEHKNKIVGNLKPGWNKGKKMPIVFREKIKNSLIGKTGKLSRNWQGGKSYEPYSVDWTETLKRSIRERDNYICPLCNQYGNYVHHIDYNKLNCSPSNLITLCMRCNSRVNGNRSYWMDYFNKII